MTSIKVKNMVKKKASSFDEALKNQLKLISKPLRIRLRLTLLLQ